MTDRRNPPHNKFTKLRIIIYRLPPLPPTSPCIDDLMIRWSEAPTRKEANHTPESKPSQTKKEAKTRQKRQGQHDRVVKGMDQKSIGLCPQGFEYPRCLIRPYPAESRLPPQTPPRSKTLERLEDSSVGKACHLGMVDGSKVDW